MSQPPMAHQQPQGQQPMQSRYPQQQPGQVAPQFAQPGAPMSSQPMPGQQPQPRRKKAGINPESVPSPVAVMAEDEARHQATQYITLQQDVPPLSCTNCVIVDEGNASPNVVRPTMGAVPITKELLKLSKIPMCLVISPLAEPNTPAQPVPVVDHGPDGPIRCRRCKAYMSCAAQFTDGGRRWTCPFCQTPNDVSDSYFCNLDHTGQRHDIRERPELLRGTVDFVAPATYCARPPQVPANLFLIDVSYNGVQNGSVVAACSAIRKTMATHEAKYGTSRPLKLGVISFDSAIHFYNLSSKMTQPQMMVVSEVDDVFSPLQTGLLVNAAESKDVINHLLDHLPSMFRQTRTVDTAFGAAVRAAIMALRETGGRVFSFLSSMPNSGPGTLKKREDVALLGTDKENKLFQPAINFYQLAAKDCVRFGISFEMFMMSNGYMDFASMAPLTDKTGGSIYRYPFFRPAQQDELASFVSSVVLRTFGVEAMLRVRTSAGLRATDFHGAMNMDTAQDVELAGVDSHKSIAVCIQHDDKLKEHSLAYFQVALLYTNQLGERRIRVHTLTLSTAAQLSDTFRRADIDALCTYLPKMAVSMSKKTPLSQIRSKITDMSVGILGAYRKHCTNPRTEASQLILPESLKLLPVYANCILKTTGIRAGADVASDERLAAMSMLQTGSPVDVMPYLYPRLVDMSIAAPRKLETLRPSSRYISEDKVFLLENGQTLFLWVGRLVSSQLLKEVFDGDSFQTFNTDMTALPSLGGESSSRFREVVQYVRSTRRFPMPLKVVKQKDPNELHFNRLLVEDKSNFGMSYVDYLCYLHREVQALNAKS
eukprot:m.162776 g.162776  ORF g.162776 m.162776 type:complete len:824 (+) comp14378_c0_seq10:2-2473(+)